MLVMGLVLCGGGCGSGACLVYGQCPCRHLPTCAVEPSGCRLCPVGDDGDKHGKLHGQFLCGCCNVVLNSDEQLEIHRSGECVAHPPRRRLPVLCLRIGVNGFCLVARRR